VRLIFFLTVLGGLGLLTLAIWPGVLEDTVFGVFRSCITLPVLGIWFFLLIGLSLNDLLLKREHRKRPRWGLWSTAVMGLTLVLLWWHVPQRLAFGLWYGEFTNLVSDAPTDRFSNDDNGHQIGLYRIDAFWADPRGGVFFRTHAGPDGIGPDEMSYGFAFQPNDEGTPFGRAHYRKRHLFGDWYAFAASNDW
jgi:hypothetical protein